MADFDLTKAMKAFTHQKEEATNKEITKWFTDAHVLDNKKTCNSNNLDIAFSKCKTKGAR